MSRSIGRIPFTGKLKKYLQQTDYKLSLERRKYLRDIHGFDDPVPDDSDLDSVMLLMI